eukprot:TCONS_00028252-protein
MSGDLLINKRREKYNDSDSEHRSKSLLDCIRKIEMKNENTSTTLQLENEVLNEKLKKMAAKRRELQNKCRLLEIENQTLCSKLNRCIEVFDIMRADLNQSLAHKRMMQEKYSLLL